MLRFDEIVFGPIFSRRLGSSLGINILPTEGKLCNFDCIYCECGWNADGRTSGSILPDDVVVRKALRTKLAQCRKDGVQIDSITFSGNGEPTLNPYFSLIVDEALSARKEFCPKAKVTVLSNATTLHRDDVFAAMCKVDNPVLKIDSPTMEGIRTVNRPVGKCSLDTIIERMKQMEGKFILQTMFLKGGGADFTCGQTLDAWMDIVREVRPRSLMVYTIDRETPMKGLSKFTVEEMTRAVQPLLDEGFDIQIKG